MRPNTNQTHYSDYPHNNDSLEGIFDFSINIFFSSLSSSTQLFTLKILLISNDRNQADHVKSLYTGLSSSIRYTPRLRRSDIT